MDVDMPILRKSAALASLVLCCVALRAAADAVIVENGKSSWFIVAGRGERDSRIRLEAPDFPLDISAVLSRGYAACDDAESRGNADADYHFAPYRDLPLARAKIGRKVENRGGRWTVTLTADTPAFFVWANARGMKGEFSDNSFTLLPERSKVLVFDAKGNDVSLESFNANLSVVSLTDSFCGNQCSFLLK